MKNECNLFSEKDKTLLRQKMKTLGKLELLILSMRFWDNMLIEEIANCLRLPWDHVNETIDKAILKLRNELMNDLSFNERPNTYSIADLNAA